MGLNSDDHLAQLRYEEGLVTMDRLDTIVATSQEDEVLNEANLLQSRNR